MFWTTERARRHFEQHRCYMPIMLDLNKSNDLIENINKEEAMLYDNFKEERTNVVGNLRDSNTSSSYNNNNDNDNDNDNVDGDIDGNTHHHHSISEHLIKNEQLNIYYNHKFNAMFTNRYLFNYK